MKAKRVRDGVTARLTTTEFEALQFVFDLYVRDRLTSAQWRALPIRTRRGLRSLCKRDVWTPAPGRSRS